MNLLGMPKIACMHAPTLEYEFRVDAHNVNIGNRCSGETCFRSGAEIKMQNAVHLHKATTFINNKCFQMDAARLFAL